MASIGTAAFMLGVSVSLLKKLGKLGVIVSPHRTATERRDYSRDDIEQIKKVIEERKQGQRKDLTAPSLN